MTDKFDGYRHGNWTFNCQICGQKAWASESRKLNVYTGRGGLRVCLECADPIDYGTVPYKIPAERPVQWSSDLMNTGSESSIPTKFTPFNYTIFDPMGTSPSVASSAKLSWDMLNIATWDTWTVPWGTFS